MLVVDSANSVAFAPESANEMLSVRLLPLTVMVRVMLLFTATAPNAMLLAETLIFGSVLVSQPHWFSVLAKSASYDDTILLKSTASPFLLPQMYSAKQG